MQYSELTLDLTPEDAAAVVSRSVDGLSRSRDGDTFRYKTNSGTTVAILSPTDRSTDSTTRLRYRTTMLSPTMATARTKARAIKNALLDYAV